MFCPSFGESLLRFEQEWYTSTFLITTIVRSDSVTRGNNDNYNHFQLWPNTKFVSILVVLLLKRNPSKHFIAMKSIDTFGYCFPECEKFHCCPTL